MLWYLVRVSVLCGEPLTYHMYMHLFAQVSFAKNNYALTAVKKFKRWLVHQQFACLRKCFDDFNVDGGAVIMVNGQPIHFARATILALYGDHPACVKSTVTGSSCPTCYQNRHEFSNADSQARPRTLDSMRVKKMNILARIQARVPGDVARARAEAKLEGVNLDIDNGWMSAHILYSASHSF
jgi:hypothetical protein